MEDIPVGINNLDHEPIEISVLQFSGGDTIILSDNAYVITDFFRVSGDMRLYKNVLKIAEKHGLKESFNSQLIVECTPATLEEKKERMMLFIRKAYDRCIYPLHRKVLFGPRY